MGDFIMDKVMPVIFVILVALLGFCIVGAFISTNYKVDMMKQCLKTGKPEWECYAALEGRQ